MPKPPEQVTSPPRRYDEHGPLREMARAEGYVMVRRHGRAPSVRSVKEWEALPVLEPVTLTESGQALPVNLVRKFLDLYLSERRSIATQLGLVGGEPVNQTDFERAKTWLLRAAETKQLVAVSQLTEEALDAR